MTQDNVQTIGNSGSGIPVTGMFSVTVPTSGIVPNITVTHSAGFTPKKITLLNANSRSSAGAPYLWSCGQVEFVNSSGYPAIAQTTYYSLFTGSAASVDVNPSTGFTMKNGDQQGYAQVGVTCTSITDTEFTLSFTVTMTRYNPVSFFIQYLVE